jgi:integrase
MASIVKLDGRWRALIRRKGYKSISKWFDTKAKATAWAKGIEAQMDDGSYGTAVASRDTVKALITRYRKLRGTTRPISDTSTEHYTLKQLEVNLGTKVAALLTVDDLLGWAQLRRDEGAGPYTINCDLSKLSTVFRYAGEGLPDVIGAARPKLSYLGLIGGGGRRERRPTEDELVRLRQLFLDQHGQQYADAMDFAAVTAMRRGEVCAIGFADIDESKKLVKVWRKHPRKGKTLEWVPLLPRAWQIVQDRKGLGGELIFPIHPQTLSKYFTEACKTLGIPDLHWHDLRHEGTSAMFESGMPIEKVALVTGHKSWGNLKRYTNLKPESVHDNHPDTVPSLDSRNIVSLRPRK